MNTIPNGASCIGTCAVTEVERLKLKRDALQLRLNAVEEENDRLRSALRTIRNHTSVSGNQIDMIDEALEKRS